LYKSLPYDPLKDFSPVIRVASAPNLLVLHPSLSVANVRELVAMARTQAGKLVYGSSGNGGGSHLAMELLKSLAKIDMLHVPYKGTGPAMIDLLSGQVKLMFGGMVGTLPTVKSGRLRAIAISSAKRSPVVPDVPTVAESGYPEYEATTWYGILAPTGTPSAVVKKLNGQIAASIQDSSLRKRITDQGGEPSSTTPEEFAAYIRSEVTKWAMVVKSSGARVD
jgi:tripartite-type tricarboxylate transporter receptor subunit TctC